MRGQPRAPHVGPSHPATPSATGPAVPAIETFQDHCVASDEWLREASAQCAQPLPFTWHPKIRVLLDLVRANARDIDRLVYRLPYAHNGDTAQDLGAYKLNFFSNKTDLERLRTKIETAYERLAALLIDKPEKLRRRSLHTFAAAGAVSLIRVLQRFEGGLFSGDELCLVRLFPDLPYVRNLPYPMVLVPFRHVINTLAYGSEGDHGFLSCRIEGAADSSFENVPLPRFDAETFQDQRPGPAHLYYGWLAPQWLMRFEQPLADETAWWISVLRDAFTGERDIKEAATPWSGNGGKQRELEPHYKWPKDAYKIVEIAPGMWCWVAKWSCEDGAG